MRRWILSTFTARWQRWSFKSVISVNVHLFRNHIIKGSSSTTVYAIYTLLRNSNFAGAMSKPAPSQGLTIARWIVQGTVWMSATHKPRKTPSHSKSLSRLHSPNRSNPQVVRSLVVWRILRRGSPAWTLQVIHEDRSAFIDARIPLLLVLQQWCIQPHKLFRSFSCHHIKNRCNNDDID